MKAALGAAFIVRNMPYIMFNSFTTAIRLRFKRKAKQQAVFLRACKWQLRFALPPL
jgi:hypothetical protein